VKTAAQPTTSAIPTSFAPTRLGLLQRKCACGGSAGPSGDCAECRKKRLQPYPTDGLRVWDIPPIVHEVLRSSGQPLEPSTHAFMEPRFGHDFSQVRVHPNARAAESAQVAMGVLGTARREPGVESRSPVSRRRATIPARV
jgi:hypothetical protein